MSEEQLQIKTESKTEESTPEGEQLFRGVVQRVTFRNSENNFSVLRVSAGDQERNLSQSNAPLTLVGVVPPQITVGSHFIARGQWQTHAKFGKQFRAFAVTESLPSGAEAIEKYLGSGAVKGFGPALARRVIEAFGEDALSILDNYPERLKEVSGIGEKKIEELKESWAEKKDMREIMLFFQSHDLPMGLAQRLYKAYGNRTIETVTRNPYVLSREIWGIGFLTADRIALALGLSKDSQERKAAGLLHILKRSVDDGHCFVPKDYLLSRTAALLELSDELELQQAFQECLLHNEIIAEGESIYLPLLNAAESEVARYISERLGHIQEVKGFVSEYIVGETIASSSRDLGSEVFTLSPEQQEAVHLAARNNLLVITGGPGCGKTTVVRTIVSMFRRAGVVTRLAAPTGRAAQRLAEVCDSKASTIHRLLKFEPSSRTFFHDRDLPIPTDVLIVDESSMIDISLAASLLQALTPDTRLIFVGDADQLPSVGPGLFLADLLSIPEIPRVRLSTLFRRDEESHITQFAHQVNSGVVPNIPEPGGQLKSDAYFLPIKTAEEGAQLIERLVTEQIPKKFGFQRSDIIVLTPMNRGDLGVAMLNQRLQARLTPPLPGSPSVKVGNIEYRLGDRVCQRVNNYQLSQGGVFNGDQGEVVGIDAGEKQLIVKLWDEREVNYSSEFLSQLDLAYALTIHRSQGSEMPAVVLALHDSHTVLLERQLLYTAITRAKKLLIIVGSKRALEIATKRSRSKRRFTRLCEKVRGGSEAEYEPSLNGDFDYME